MPTITSITTTYAGEFAGKYLSAALLSGRTLANQAVEILPNINYKQVMQKVGTDDLMKDATCDFDPTSTVTLTERILEPKQMQVNLTLCKKDFFNTWQAVEMGYSSFKELPKSFADYLIAYAASKIGAAVETDLWTGANATDHFAGFGTIIAAGGSVVPSVTPTTVVASNVITELGKVVDAIPATVYSHGREDLTIYVPANVYRAYVRALGGFGASGLGAAGVDNKGTMWYQENQLSFDGIPLFFAPGLASNTMIAAQKSNLFFGTGLLSDHNEVKVLDMADLDGSNNVRVIMRFSAGTQIGVLEDCVKYGLA
jgi:hypothetical protein